MNASLRTGIFELIVAMSLCAFVACGGGGSKADGAPGDTNGGDSSPAIACTLDGGECPSGYRCGCGGPGPGVCTCHKQCASDSECTGTGEMCGCSPTDPAPRICVNLCFCACN